VVRFSVLALEAAKREDPRSKVLTKEASMRLRSRLTIVGLVLAAFAAIAAAQERPSRPGDGVTEPRVVKEVHPVYTDEAKRHRIQGTVTMDVVVLADGTVGDVTVTKSLDTEYGLDEQAVNAVKQWRFRPGTKDDKPVNVLVTIEMSFTLK
jgi:TonB family protein